MKTSNFLCLFFFFFIISGQSMAQEIVANNDDYCVDFGDQPTTSILLNDELFGITNPDPALITFNYDPPSPCFFIDDLGFVQINYSLGDSCCGTYVIPYVLCVDGDICDQGIIDIEIKCGGKPDCSLFNMEDLTGGDDLTGDGQAQDCISVCEGARTTFYYPYNPAYTYNWTTSLNGGSWFIGANDGEIIVDWGLVGSGNISLEILDSTGNVIETISVCVDILPAPVAGFTTPGYACLGQPMNFTNTSSPTTGLAYEWDFGDGNFSNLENPSHVYTDPGTYTVTLCATNQVFDDAGYALCCCTDCYSFDVVVDSLPGPNIYWISTLCQGDSSKYWTDATNCTNYTWSVFDDNGTAMSFDGQGNDTICVHWTNGNFGEITLNVSGCDSTYCSNPTTVFVPIIPAVSSIEGPQVVCEFETACYEIPKWEGTVYTWTVLDQLGSPVPFDGQGGHQICVHWGTAGMGTIHVDYSNEFLNGLPEHSGSECTGFADLDVEIRPEFSLVSSNIVCVNSTSFISPTQVPWNNYTWTIDPPVTFTTFPTGIQVDWDVVGTYVVTATPTDLSFYCNEEAQFIVTVVDVDAPISIDGPLEFCPGDQFVYTANSTESNVSFGWFIDPPSAATISSFVNTATVTWSSSGSLNVFHQMTNNPFCLSDTISIDVTEKELEGPLNVTGSAACTNSTSVYNLTPPQHADAEITWSVADSTTGSVVNGQGTDLATIQWNNDPGPVAVIVEVTLCDSTLTFTLNDTLYSPLIPNITQRGYLCPGVTDTLDVDPTTGFVSYLWSTGSTMSFTEITAGGQYSVTTTDINGCEATSYYDAYEIDPPVAAISSLDNPNLCIGDLSSVLIEAQTNPSYEFEWYCSSILTGGPNLVQGPSGDSNFEHFNTQFEDTNTYYIEVEDLLTGCTNQSLPFVVTQDSCNTTGGPCVPITNNPGTINFGLVTPGICDEYQFNPSLFPGVTVDSWSFGDGNISAATSPIHQYNTAGCYHIVLDLNVPDTSGTGFCPAVIDTGLCVPVAAYFDFEYVTCNIVQFNDLSTYIGTGNSITSWSWSFGSGAPNPSASFTSGSHVVTLTVTDATGCTATHTETINIGAVSIASMTATSVPDPPCVGDAVTFNATAPGAVSWLWDFGDGATFGDQSPQHTYLAAGSYTVNLSVTDADGCTDTQTITVNVIPGLPPMSINPGNSVICDGESITLSVSGAPGGSTYLWSTGDTTPTINVNATGDYSVIVTDSNGCTLELDPVHVDVIPNPDATISGNTYICGSGNCTTLSVPSGPPFLYNYLWEDANGPTGSAFSNELEICDPNVFNPYMVTVISSNGCSSVSDPVFIQVVTPPAFTVSISPDPCAGKADTLTVVPYDPSLNYYWSNGDTGEFTVVSLAGEYSVTAVDPVTGCSHTETVEIYPLPDLCLVPQGCYEVCDPDTVCGPTGYTSYQWLLDGSPVSSIPGSPECVEVTMSGTYNLAITNSFGCTDTSDVLILEVIDCDSLNCDDIWVDWFHPVDSDGNVDSCCAVINYVHNANVSLKGLQISTLDSDINFDLSSLSPDFSVQSISSNSISLQNIIAGNPIPTGFNSNVIDFCLENIVNSPQVIYIEWIDFNNEVVCVDSIQFSCPVDECLHLESHDIYCEEGLTIYEMTVCNPPTNPYDIGYIDLSVISPVGITLTPSAIDITGSPLAPGDCQTFTFQLSGAGIAGEQFCYQLLGHEFNPNLVDTSWCCSLDTIYCIDIPPCDPCDDVFIEAVDTVDDCCYDIYINNGYDPAFFDEIAVCVISPSTTMTVNNPFTSPWTTSGYTPTSVSFLPNDGFVPLGTNLLPEICLETFIAPNQQLEIKWIHEGVVYCSDTIDVFCEPDCGYLFEETITCDPNTGTWIYDGLLKNKSGVTVNEAVITINSPAGLSGYNSVHSLGSLADDAIFSSINFPIGYPAQAGDTICFTVTLHEISQDGLYLTCCNFNHCIVLPDCGFVNECLCDDQFYESVALGFDCLQPTPDLLFYEFDMIAPFFDDCDQIMWSFGDQTGLYTTTGSQTITHQFATSGMYQVCIRVTRTASDGTQCIEKFCKWIEAGVPVTPQFSVFPNPSDGIVYTKINAQNRAVEIHIYDLSQRVVYQGLVQDPIEDMILQIDLSSDAKGLYFVHFKVGDEVWIEKVTLY